MSGFPPAGAGLRVAERRALRLKSKKQLVFLLLYINTVTATVAAGTAAGLLLILLSTLYVWRIEIVGNVNISDKVIYQALAESGLDIGTYIPTLQPNSVRTLLILKLTELSSASVNIKGNHITVEVIERNPPPNL